MVMELYCQRNEQKDSAGFGQAATSFKYIGATNFLKQLPKFGGLAMGSKSARSRRKELRKRAKEYADDVDQEERAETGKNSSAGRPKEVMGVKREAKTDEHQIQMHEKRDAVQRGLQRGNAVLGRLIDVQERAASQDWD